MQRSLTLVLATALASSACALNFDQFVDGSAAPMDVAAFEAGPDTNPSTGCPYPWLLIGVAGAESSTLQRYTFTSSSTPPSRCSDFTGMPANLEAFSSITPLRYAVLNSDDTHIVDATRPIAAQPIEHLADTVRTTVFTLYHATIPYVVVPYRSASGGESITTVRIIELSSVPYPRRDWLPASGTEGPTVSEPVTAMTLDPGAAGRVVATTLTNSVRTIDVFGTANDLFRSSTAGIVNSARGVWGDGVGFGLGESNAPEFSLSDTSRSTAMSSANGPHSCSGCPFATRMEVLPDPTGGGAFLFCRVPDGLARVVRWDSVTDRCQLVDELNEASSNGRRFMSIEIVPSATRN